jgi:iron complex transport system substrate-binding protein
MNWYRLGLTVVLMLRALTAQALQLTDDRGVVVRFNAPPQRIVSLLPSLSETVCALGACARLVGVDRYSTYPAQLQKLPQLGGGIDPQIERIVALRPDVVLIASSARAWERLEALGLKVVALEPKNMADVQRVLQTVGQLLGSTDAPRLWQQMNMEVTQAARDLPATVRGTRVYFEVNEGPYAASEASFIGELLLRLGVSNIVPAALGPFPQLNPEFVVRANPEVILVGQASAMALTARPGWAGLRALREQRVCTFSTEEGDVLVRPGPRMAQAARIMARCLAAKSPRTGGMP